MIYEVVTNEGRCVELPYEAWARFPSAYRRQLAGESRYANEPLHAALTTIAGLPEPMNTKSAARAQCEHLKELARKALGA